MNGAKFLAARRKGKTVGVASLRGSTIFATRYALRKIGLNPDRDVSFVQVGKARSLKPENFIDATFIAELDKNGYIDRLYRRN